MLKTNIAGPDEVSPAIKKFISKAALWFTLKNQAMKECIRTMQKHGIEEELNCTTTVEEVVKYT